MVRLVDTVLRGTNPLELDDLGYEYTTLLQTDRQLRHLFKYLHKQ